MPSIENGTLPSGDLEGADLGATISLILDESEPGRPGRLSRRAPGRVEGTEMRVL